MSASVARQMATCSVAPGTAIFACMQNFRPEQQHNVDHGDPRNTSPRLSRFPLGVILAVALTVAAAVVIFVRSPI